MIPTKVINQLGIIGAVSEVNEGQRVLSPVRKKLNLRPKADDPHPTLDDMLLNCSVFATPDWP